MNNTPKYNNLVKVDPIHVRRLLLVNVIDENKDFYHEDSTHKGARSSANTHTTAPREIT